MWTNWPYSQESNHHRHFIEGLRIHRRQCFCAESAAVGETRPFVVTIAGTTPKHLFFSLSLWVLRSEMAVEHPHFVGLSWDSLRAGFWGTKLLLLGSKTRVPRPLKDDYAFCRCCIGPNSVLSQDSRACSVCWFCLELPRSISWRAMPFWLALKRC